MCVILATLGAGAPSRGTLKRACAANPDGFGWGVLIDDDEGARVVTDHSLRAGDAIGGYRRTIREHDDAVRASIFHARIATHGAVSVANCHPFEIGDGSGAWLAHNGILPVRSSVERSDSRTFAEDILPALGGSAALTGAGAEVLDGWVTDSYSKIAALVPADSLGLVILGEGLGTWYGSTWHSNDSALVPALPAASRASGMGSRGGVRAVVSTASRRYFSDTWDTVDEDTDRRHGYGASWVCAQCDGIVDGLDALGQECPWCGACQDCGEIITRGGYCACNRPAYSPPASLTEVLQSGWSL